MKTDNQKKLKMQSILSMLILIIGMLLMVFKIYADSEPGALPLLLVIVGAGWYLVTIVRMRSQGRIE